MTNFPEDYADALKIEPARYDTELPERAAEVAAEYKRVTGQDLTRARRAKPAV